MRRPTCPRSGAGARPLVGLGHVDSLVGSAERSDGASHSTLPAIGAKAPAPVPGCPSTGPGGETGPMTATEPAPGGVEGFLLPLGRRGVRRLLGGHGRRRAADAGLRRLRGPPFPPRVMCPRVPVDRSRVGAALGSRLRLVLRGAPSPAAAGLRPLRPVPRGQGELDEKPCLRMVGNLLPAPDGAINDRPGHRRDRRACPCCVRPADPAGRHARHLPQWVRAVDRETT